MERLNYILGYGIDTMSGKCLVYIAIGLFLYIVLFTHVAILNESVDVFGHTFPKEFSFDKVICFHCGGMFLKIVRIY